DTRNPHSRIHEMRNVAVVDLVAVAVPLYDLLPAIDLAAQATRQQHAFLSAQAHGAPHVRPGIARFQLAVASMPFVDQGDDGMWSVWIELCAVGALQSRLVACIFDHGELQPQTDPEVWDFVFSRIADGLNLSLHSAFAESAG